MQDAVTEHVPKAMGTLAESLIWPAIDLVGLVKGGGDRDEIGQLLSDLTDEQRWAFPVILAAMSDRERWAMLVVLAGMVDPEKTPDELLGWITWDETGRHLLATRAVTPRWRVRVPCGTVESLRRHDLLGEDCETCTTAETARAARGAERRERSRRREAA